MSDGRRLWQDRGRRGRRPGGRRYRDQRGSSLLVIALMLTLLTVTLMPLMVQAGLAGRVSYSSARSQQRLRLVDTALNETVSQLRLAREATDTACYGATETASGSGVFEFPAVPVPLPGVDDDGLGAADGAGSAEVIVRCQAVSASSISPESREIFLQAALTTSGGGWNDNPIGLARVKYLDKDGPREAPGMEMIVCDWRLGRFDAGFGGLSQCP
jgi:hypothetical protein